MDTYEGGFLCICNRRCNGTNCENCVKGIAANSLTVYINRDL